MGVVIPAKILWLEGQVIKDVKKIDKGAVTWAVVAGARLVQNTGLFR
jgi:hypothetical protein